MNWPSSTTATPHGLRHVAADRESWTGAELRRLLLAKTGLSLTSSSMSALMATEPDKQPREVKVRTLAAPCTVLNCTPNDLLEIARVTALLDHVATRAAGPRGRG